MRATSIAAAIVTLSSACAFAQSPQMLGSNESWSAWRVKESDASVCYVYSDSVSKKPNHLDHGRVSLFVRHLKSGKARTEASLQVGYEFAPTAVSVVVDGKRFTMIPRGNYAWLRRTERESEFVRALEKGRSVNIEASSQRGNKTAYGFSLKGFAAAMRKARQGCR